MKTYDEAQAEIRELNRRWLPRILNSFPPGRAPGNRPRDPEQERLLIRMTRRRLEARATEGVDGPENQERLAQDQGKK